MGDGVPCSKCNSGRLILRTIADDVGISAAAILLCDACGHSHGRSVFRISDEVPDRFSDYQVPCPKRDCYTGHLTVSTVDHGDGGAGVLWCVECKQTIRAAFFAIEVSE